MAKVDAVSTALPTGSIKPEVVDGELFTAINGLKAAADRFGGVNTKPPKLSDDIRKLLSETEATLRKKAAELKGAAESKEAGFNATEKDTKLAKSTIFIALADTYKAILSGKSVNEALKTPGKTIITTSINKLGSKKNETPSLISAHKIIEALEKVGASSVADQISAKATSKSITDLRTTLSKNARKAVSGLEIQSSEQTTKQTDDALVQALSPLKAGGTDGGVDRNAAARARMAQQAGIPG